MNGDFVAGKLMFQRDALDVASWFHVAIMRCLAAPIRRFISRLTFRLRRRILVHALRRCGPWPTARASRYAIYRRMGVVLLACDDGVGRLQLIVEDLPSTGGAMPETVKAIRDGATRFPLTLKGEVSAAFLLREQDLEQAPPDYFETAERRHHLDAMKAKRRDWFDVIKFGTVGAVARDRQGHLAAATSTGGITQKRWVGTAICLS